MNKLIKIKSTIQIEEIEGLYDELYAYNNSDYIVDLQIPKSLTKSYFGLAPSMIQFVSTWVRFANSGKLFLQIKDTSEKSITELYTSEIIFPCVSLVWNNNGVYNSFNGDNLREVLREAQNETVKKMSRVEALKGEKLLLTNLDFSFSIPCLEKNNEFIQEEIELHKSLSKPLSEQVLKLSFEARKYFEYQKRPFINIIYELMKNTYEWARTDEEEVPYDPNIRGLFVKFFRKPRDKFVEEYMSTKQVSDYFNSKIHKENYDGQLYFLEITVFDSGSGLVKKYKSLNESNAKNDVGVIKECLIKNNTTAKGLDKTEKGRGLDRILETLDGKGFLRIRTDKYSVYRDLIKDRYIKTNNIEDIVLYDWGNNTSDKFKEMQYASGTVITIIYPLATTTRDEQLF